MGVTSRLVYDPTDANTRASGSTIGGLVLAGDDGTAIGHHTLNAVEWLNTTSALFAGDGATAISATGTALDVNLASGSISTAYSYAEDSAFTEADEGVHNLTVRQDTLATSTSADGDYTSMKSNSLGELYVTDSSVLAELQGGISVDDGGGSLTVDAIDLDIRDLTAASDSVQSWLYDGAGTALTSTLIGSDQALDVNIVGGDIDDDLANTAIENTATAVSTVAVNVVTSALSGRKWLAYANEGNKTIYFGKTGVTTANGFPAHPGQQAVWRVGPAVAPQMIGGAGASSEDIRIMELS